MGYEIDEYICPTAREDGDHTNDFLIALVLRDFAETEDFSAEARKSSGESLDVKKLNRPVRKRHRANGGPRGTWCGRQRQRSMT